jgi:predicted restriction endonuclease
MLTERGFDQALALCNIPAREKENLPTKSYEVQRIVNKLLAASVPENYSPFDIKKRRISMNAELLLRSRGFRQAVIEAYAHRCAVCGLKIQSPDLIAWEVQAAHIVPNGLRGRDDICNGIALCRLHQWAFDVGWFTLLDDYRLEVSPKINGLPPDAGRIDKFEFLRSLAKKRSHIHLPSRRAIHSHRNSITWHRQNVFHYDQ